MEEKQEQVKAASYIDKLLKGKLDAGFTDNDLPLTLTKKDIPPEIRPGKNHSVFGLIKDLLLLRS